MTTNQRGGASDVPPPKSGPDLEKFSYNKSSMYRHHTHYPSSYVVNIHQYQGRQSLPKSGGGGGGAGQVMWKHSR